MTNLPGVDATIPARSVFEPARETPVTGNYDLIVAGGGIAGVAAAVAAARSGVSVCLLEKTFALGGLATLGNVTVWLPLCDGRGRQVIGGLSEELLKLSVADLPANNADARFIGIPPCWLPGGDVEQRRKTRFQTRFNPASYLLALEALLTAAGVDLFYDTRICAAPCDGDRITHLIVENKSGRSAMACRAVIDATGDADICHLAGEATESLDSNVLCGWFYYVTDGRLRLAVVSNHYDPEAAKERSVGPFFRGDDARQVTDQLLGSRDLLRARLTDLRQRLAPADAQAVNVPTLPCFRMTRRLIGAGTLTAGDVHAWPADAIGLTGDWRKAGPVWAIPLGALRAPRTRNLLAAGRCISADTTVWDVTRAIPGCAVTGEAAGMAMAMAIRRTDGDAGALPIGELQDHLRSRGVLLDPALAALADDSSAPAMT